MGLPIRVALVSLYAYLAVSISVVVAEQIDLSAQRPSDGLTQVTVELEAAGSTLVRSEADGKSGKAPSGVCRSTLRLDCGMRSVIFLAAIRTGAASAC